MSQSEGSDSSKSTRNSGLLSRLGDFWCRSMHNSPMMPIHGRYQCRRCHRYHHVTWEDRPDVNEPKNQAPSR